MPSPFANSGVAVPQWPNKAMGFLECRDRPFEPVWRILDSGKRSDAIYYEDAITERKVP